MRWFGALVGLCAAVGMDQTAEITLDSLTAMKNAAEDFFERKEFQKAKAKVTRPSDRLKTGGKQLKIIINYKP